MNILHYASDRYNWHVTEDGLALPFMHRGRRYTACVSCIGFGGQPWRVYLRHGVLIGGSNSCEMGLYKAAEWLDGIGATICE